LFAQSFALGGIDNSAYTQGITINRQIQSRAVTVFLTVSCESRVLSFKGMRKNKEIICEGDKGAVQNSSPL
jgi:hypothetical protein